MRITNNYIVNISLALAILIITFPVIITLLLPAVFWDKKLLFYQKRMGKDGEAFDLIKIQTMDDSPLSNGESSPVGKILRRYRVDELPQLFNVLKGEMNIIGCRPVTFEIYNEVNKKVYNYDLRHRFKPGITGYAQVKMGYASTIQEEVKKFEYDKYYIENRSVWLDIKILWWTVVAILKGKGQ